MVSNERNRSMNNGIVEYEGRADLWCEGASPIRLDLLLAMKHLRKRQKVNG
jgi:hypothetical protein